MYRFANNSQRGRARGAAACVRGYRGGHDIRRWGGGMSQSIAMLVAAAVMVLVAGAADEGLVAEWRFDRGAVSVDLIATKHK